MESVAFMTELYSDTDLQQLSSQLKKRYALLGVILAIVLGFFIYSERSCRYLISSTDSARPSRRLYSSKSVIYSIGSGLWSTLKTS